MRITLPCGVLALGIAASSSIPAQFNVTQVTPTQETTDASALGHVTWTLSAPVDPATVDSASVMVFGRWSGVTSGARSLENGNTRIRFTPSDPFSAGEMVTAILTPALASSVGVALPHTHATQFRITVAPALPTFSLQSMVNVRQPGEGVIRSYGAYAGDLNNDGYCDLLVPNEDASDVRRFMNDGAGGFSGFTIHTLPFNSKPSSNEGADFNGDGWTDFVVCNITGHSVAVFLNDGTGDLLSPVLVPVGASPRGVAVIDADSDGDTDIVTANRVDGTLSLVRNNGDGTFQPALPLQGGVSNETSIAPGDANGDGIMDIFVGGYSSQNVALLLGNGAGGFTVSATVAAGGRPWMLASGDVDLDGDVDVVAVLTNTDRVSVMRNNGASGFLPAVTYPCGPFSTAVDLGDLDGDGDLDIVTSSYSGAAYSVFHNLGNGTYTSGETLPAVSAGSCAVLADINGDEDAEVIGIDELADLLLFFDSRPLPYQQASLGAGLEINGAGGSPGYGGAPPLPVTLGSVVTFDMQGHPGEAWALAVGFPEDPGFPTRGGTLGLALNPVPLRVVNGLVNPAFVLDPTGSAVLPMTVPGWLPPGLELTFQGLATNPANLALGITLTNPIAVVTN